MEKEHDEDLQTTRQRGAGDRDQVIGPGVEAHLQGAWPGPASSQPTTWDTKTTQGKKSRNFRIWRQVPLCLQPPQDGGQPGIYLPDTLDNVNYINKRIHEMNQYFTATSTSLKNVLKLTFSLPTCQVQQVQKVQPVQCGSDKAYKLVWTLFQ